MIFQTVLCIAVVLMGAYWNKDGSLNTGAYIPIAFAFDIDAVLKFFTYFILMNTLLPISLIITMELVKVC